MRPATSALARELGSSSSAAVPLTASTAPTCAGWWSGIAHMPPTSAVPRIEKSVQFVVDAASCTSVSTVPLHPRSGMTKPSPTPSTSTRQSSPPACADWGASAAAAASPIPRAVLRNMVLQAYSRGEPTFPRRPAGFLLDEVYLPGPNAVIQSTAGTSTFCPMAGRSISAKPRSRQTTQR